MQCSSFEKESNKSSRMQFVNGNCGLLPFIPKKRQPYFDDLSSRKYHQIRLHNSFCFYKSINGLIEGKFLKNRGSRFAIFLLTNAGNSAHFEWIWAGLVELLNSQITSGPHNLIFLGLV